MYKGFISWADFVLVPLYFLILFVFILFIKKNHKDNILYEKFLVKGFVFNGEKYKVYNLEKKGQWYKSWFGVIILKEGKPAYVVFLYERKGSDFDETRGILTLRGIEETVTIFFDNGEVKRNKN